MKECVALLQKRRIVWTAMKLMVGKVGIGDLDACGCSLFSKRPGVLNVSPISFPAC